MNSKKGNLQDKLSKEQLRKIFRYGSLQAVLQGKNYAMELLIDKMISLGEAREIFNLLQKYAEGFKNITDLDIENKIRNLQAEKYAYELSMANAKNVIPKFESSVKFLDKEPSKPKKKKDKKETKDAK